MGPNLRLRLADGSEFEAAVEGQLSATLRDLLAVGYVGNQMKIEADESDDVEGHAPATTLRVLLYDEDDVEGHALTLHLPSAQAAHDLQKKLLAAGIAGVVVVGAAMTVVVAPDFNGTTGQAGAPAVPIAAPAPATAPGLKADLATGDAAAPVLAPAPATAPGLKADLATGDAAAPAAADVSDESSHPAMPGESRAR